MDQSRRARLRDAMREWLPTEQHVYLYLLEFLAYPSGLCEASPDLIARDTGLSRQSVRKALECLTHRELDGAPLWFWDPKTFVGLFATWRIDFKPLKDEHVEARIAYAESLPTTPFVADYIAAMKAIKAGRQYGGRRHSAAEADLPTTSTSGAADSDVRQTAEPPAVDSHTAECRATKKLPLYQGLCGLRRVVPPRLVDLHPSHPTGARLLELNAKGEAWVRSYVTALAARLDESGRLAGVRHGRGHTPNKTSLELLLQQDVIDAVMDRTGGAS